MDTKSRYLKALGKGLYSAIAAAIAALSMLSSSAVYADDTEVFLGSTTPDTNNTRPNILFILDTSRSMDIKDIPDAPGKSRLDVMKQAMVGLLNQLNNVNVGLVTFNSIGGPVRFPLSYIDGDADAIEGGGFNINLPVQNSADDAAENTSSKATDIDDTYLHLTEAIDMSSAEPPVMLQVGADIDDVEEAQSDGDIDTNANDLIAHGSTDIGLRFQGVNIPNNATIISAELTMIIDPDGNNNNINGVNEHSEASFAITGEASDSAPQFTFTNNMLKNRPRTLELPWNNVAPQDRGLPITSPNLSPIIQEIVARPGWASGNSIALFIETMSGFRDLESYGGNESKAPRLTITYTTDTDRIPQLLGLRFAKVDIPQGAEIRRAFLEFTSASTSDDPISFTIRGEAVGNAAPFAETPGNISARTPTGQGVAWTLADTDPWEADERYQTPDLKDVIQEIVNHDDWCGGQDLSLILQPGTAGMRMIKSFDGTTIADAPMLRIEFDTNTENITSGTGCMINEITSRVSNSFDDAEEQSSSNSTIVDGDVLQLIRSSGNNQEVGVRFRDINLAPGSEVLDARLEFTADGDSSGGLTLTIHGHKVPDSPPFDSGTDNKNISNRINNQSTASTVSWSPGSWDNKKVYGSENISPIVQEIIDQPGWAAGNSLSLLITGTSETREAYSWDGAPERAPRLVMTAKQLLAGQPSDNNTVRERLIQEITNLRTVWSTPTVNTYMEGIRYYRGMPVYWGRERGDQIYSFFGSGGDRFGRISHMASHTGGTLVQPAGCSNLNLDDTACLEETIDSSPVYISPIEDACQSNYIVLLSDGEQNSYSDNDDIEALIATAPDPFPGTCAAEGPDTDTDGDGPDVDVDTGGADCGLKLAEFAHSFDQRADLPGEQKITTFSIGFAFTSSFLQNMGIKGGGQYKNASSSAELIDAFEAFFADILSQPSTFTAPTLTISAFNRLFNSNEIYISLFEPERSTAWSGNVKKYFLCTPEQDKAGTCTTGQLMDDNDNDAAENGQIVSGAVSDWGGFEDGPDVELGGAGAQITDHASRSVYTYTGSSDDLGDSSNAVNTANVSAASLGVTAAEHADLIQWIRGQDVDDEDSDGATTDTRWAFGDPLHSAAVTVNYGISSGDVPITKLFVGTNDGGFRMINTHTGKEEWIFIPPEFLLMQKDLRADSNPLHKYGMDGSPVAWVLDNDGDGKIEPTGDPATNDFVKIVVGQRRGGKSYYALDVSPGSVLTDPTATNGVSPVRLWKIDNNTSGYSRLGQTWSKPFVTSILVNEGGVTMRKNVVIFAGGYDEQNDAGVTPTPGAFGNAIYIVDAEDGSVIWSVSGTAGGAVQDKVTEMQYSIPSDVRLIDMDGDGATDRLYVGDLGGQVWRVDLTGPLTKGQKTNTVVGRLATLSGSAPEDQRRIMYRPEVALISDKQFANGTYVALALATGDREDPLGETVHDRLYVLRDYTLGHLPDTDVNSEADASFHTITHVTDDLVDVTADITAANATLNGASVYGWYVEFKEPDRYVGEKSITEGQILISSKPQEPPVFTFNTYIPNLAESDSACSVSLGTNRSYFVNLLNGTGTTHTDVGSRSKINESYGIASDIIVVQQHGQQDVSVGGGTTDPTNMDLGDTLLPIYITE